MKLKGCIRRDNTRFDGDELDVRRVRIRPTYSSRPAESEFTWEVNQKMTSSAITPYVLQQGELDGHCFVAELCKSIKKRIIPRILARHTTKHLEL